MDEHKAIDLSGVAEIQEWANQKFPPATGVLELTETWEGAGPYTQAVTIPDTTANSKIDLQPDAATLSQLSSDGVQSLWIENDDGALTAYALGAAPTAALSVQYTKTEVSV